MSGPYVQNTLGVVPDPISPLDAVNKRYADQVVDPYIEEIKKRYSYFTVAATATNSQRYIAIPIFGSGYGAQVVPTIASIQAPYLVDNWTIKGIAFMWRSPVTSPTKRCSLILRDVGNQDNLYNSASINQKVRYSANIVNDIELRYDSRYAIVADFDSGLDGGVYGFGVRIFAEPPTTP